MLDADQFDPAPAQFSVGLNCQNPDCEHGSPIQVLRPFRECRNVTPSPVGNEPMNCIDDITSRTTQSAIDHQYVVAWRYVTLGDRYVLVDDTNVTDESNANWVFMDRRAFRSQLCTKTATSKYNCGSTGSQP